MKHPCSLTAVICLVLTASAWASPQETKRIQKSWELAMQRWSREMQLSTTPETRAATLAKRPDTTPYARKVWQQIGPSLGNPWILEPAAWFLKVTPGLYSSNPDGTNTQTFAKEIETIKKVVAAQHIKSPGMIPMCMALVATNDPKVLPILEKVMRENPDPKTQGVAALGAAMMLKSLGDEPELMRKRLSYLRDSIIKSSDVKLENGTVAEIAENELYIIRFLTKGRVAPDLTGIDSAGRTFKLSEFAGKVVLLLFWNSEMPEAERVYEMTRETQRKLEGKPFVVLGVNHDPIGTLRDLEGKYIVSWRNFSDPGNKLAQMFRVGNYPLVYVLDQERKIQYSGSPGSFAELTAAALLSDQ